MNRVKRIIFFHLPLIVVIIFVDLYSKVIVDQNLVLGESINVIPKFFNLTLVYNKGAAFGMFAGLSDEVRKILLWVVSLIAMGFVVSLYIKLFFDRFSTVFLSLILGGAVGNGIDRYRYDYVIDFFDFYIGNYHWPAFNVADSCICVGVFLLIVRMSQLEMYAYKSDASNANLREN